MLFCTNIYFWVYACLSKKESMPSTINCQHCAPEMGFCASGDWWKWVSRTVDKKGATVCPKEPEPACEINSLMARIAVKKISSQEQVERWRLLSGQRLGKCLPSGSDRSTWTV